MSQANVITSSGTVTWYTDKCGISTTDSLVTYQVYATALGSATAVGNIYSDPAEIGLDSYKEIYVGVGNYLTLTGTGFTAQELGTRSSAQAGVFNGTPNIAPPPDSPITTQSGDVITTQSGDLLVTN